MAAGTEVVRVNCAHDGPAQWAAMIANVRTAARAHGRHVKVTMDIAGPKLRTGPILPGAAVAHIKPTRDDLGRCATPAQAWLTLLNGPACPQDGRADHFPRHPRIPTQSPDHLGDARGVRG